MGTTSRNRLFSARLFDRLTAAIYNESLTSTLRALIEPQPGLRLLDVPCGTGSLFALAHPCDYYGIDVTQERIVHASAALPSGRFLVGNAAALPFQRGAFDRILVSGLFHHVDDATADSIGAELARVLRPGGHIVVLEAIWPRRWYNLAGFLARKLDEGRFVRWTDQYFRLWEARFESTAVHYPRRLSMEYLLVRLRPKTP